MIIDKILSEILGREKSMFQQDLANNSEILKENISKRTMLVIGGAGTIGSSFIKAALKFQPDKIVIVDINENGLTELVRDLRSTVAQFIPDVLLTYPISFHDPIFKKLFLSHGPFDIVANFAAHKHVRSEKDIFSIEALLQNNFVHAKDLLDLLLNHPPRHFFCVSTDKAANPVNVMGASKKMMEELILTYSDHYKVTTARFANVAFSNGSLLEGFLNRIDKRQPIACPTDVTRFFVSPEEAGEICLLACILGNSGQIFFPKLDFEKDLVNFKDILYKLLKEKFSYEPFICVSAEEARDSMQLLKEGKYPVHLFKSDTSGEKLYEEFFTEEEILQMSLFDALGVINKEPTYTITDFNNIIQDLKELLGSPGVSKKDIVSWLRKYISDFDHIETGLNLDSKM